MRSPEMVNVVGAEALVLVEGSIFCSARVRSNWPAGVLDYGTFARGLGRNLGGPSSSVREDPGWTAG